MCHFSILGQIRDFVSYFRVPYLKFPLYFWTKISLQCYTTDPSIRWQFCAYDYEAEPVDGCLEENACESNKTCIPTSTGVTALSALHNPENHFCISEESKNYLIELQYRTFYRRNPIMEVPIPIRSYEYGSLLYQYRGAERSSVSDKRIGHNISIR